MRFDFLRYLLYPLNSKEERGEKEENYIFLFFHFLSLMFYFRCHLRHASFYAEADADVYITPR